MPGDVRRETLHARDLDRAGQPITEETCSVKLHSPKATRTSTAPGITAQGKANGHRTGSPTWRVECNLRQQLSAVLTVYTDVLKVHCGVSTEVQCTAALCACVVHVSRARAVLRFALLRYASRTAVGIHSFIHSFIHFISFHFISFHFISFHFISFHFISFHFISFHFISFHFISFHFISFHFISFHFISFHFISFHFISFHFISFHFISFHFISFHFISFHFISFHFISFHFISFHFISFIRHVALSTNTVRGEGESATRVTQHARASLSQTNVCRASVRHAAWLPSVGRAFVLQLATRVHYELARFGHCCRFSEALCYGCGYLPLWYRRCNKSSAQPKGSVKFFR